MCGGFWLGVKEEMVVSDGNGRAETKREVSISVKSEPLGVLFAKVLTPKAEV